MATVSGSQASAETRALLRLAATFWTGGGRWSHWSGLAAIALFVAWQTQAQVGLTNWSRSFFDALSARSIADLWVLAGGFPVLAAAYMVAVTGMVVGRMLLQWHWRRHLTSMLIARWLANGRHYRVDAVSPAMTAPESRIIDDVRASIEPLGELGVGLASNLTSAVAFSVILASVGGTLTVTVAGHAVAIPAYMLLVTLAYAAMILTLTWLTGRQLVPLSFRRNDAEARLRAALGRVRENAESVALAGGEEAEARRTGHGLAQLGQAWHRLIGQNAVLGLALNLNGALFPVVPIVFAAPKYLAGGLSMGEIVQLTAAFTAVQAGLLWSVDNIVKLTEWRAAARRVGALALALDRVPAPSQACRKTHRRGDRDALLVVEGLRVGTGPGPHAARPLTFHVAAGESVLLMGPSGIGKTSVLRAIVGLLEPSGGHLSLESQARLAIVPQKPYLTVGRLRDLVSFPRADRSGSEAIAEALVRCGLGHLSNEIDSARAWDRVLSMGERQRLAFANLSLRDLDLILLDEATSALDEAAQASLMSDLRRSKPACAILSIGHRPSLVALHDRVVELDREASSGAPASDSGPASLGPLDHPDNPLPPGARTSWAEKLRDCRPASAALLLDRIEREIAAWDVVARPGRLDRPAP